MRARRQSCGNVKDVSIEGCLCARCGVRDADTCISATSGSKCLTVYRAGLCFQMMRQAELVVCSLRRRLVVGAFVMWIALLGGNLLCLPLQTACFINTTLEQI